MGASDDWRGGHIIPAAQRSITPKVSGLSLTGTHLDVANWRGAPVVVNFWGSWCAPCREEAGDLRKTALATQPLGVHFVGVDLRDDPASGRAFTENFKIPYPSIRDDEGLIEFEFGPAVPRAVPTTHILDAKGRIAVEFVGKITFVRLEPTLLQILTETNPDLISGPSTPIGS